MKNKLDFFWNGSIAGITYSFKVNGKEHFLGFPAKSEEDTKNEISEILKEKYNIDIEPNNINFTWGGRL